MIRSFLPVPEETGPYKRLYAIVIPLFVLMVLFLAVAVFI
jgi:hypothetical protein